MPFVRIVFWETLLLDWAGFAVHFPHLCRRELKLSWNRLRALPDELGELKALK